MRIWIDKEKRYRITLTNGEVIEGIAIFYRTPNTPEHRPICLMTEEGEIQVDSNLVMTCREINALNVVCPGERSQGKKVI